MSHSRARAAAVLAVLVLTVAACGDDENSATPTSGAAATDAPASSPADTSPPDSAAPAETAATVDGETSAPSATDAPDAAAVEFPLTVEHKYGSTTIPAKPERIVSLDTQWTDVLLSLDAPLVGRALDPYVPGGTFAWQEGLDEGVTHIEATDSIPFEQVAALDPDLIVVTYFVQDEATYDQLSQIAPTIPLLGTGDQVDEWQEMATLAGQFLDDPGAAADLIASVDGVVEATIADLPGLEGRTYALANWVPGDAIYVVADPEDGATVLFSQLGMSITPSVLEVADGVSGRATLSLENISLLDGDLLVLFTNGADPDDIPGYSALPAVQNGAVSVLDYGSVVGLNTPTPLSIPYSLELIRPALEAAAAAG